MDKNSLVTISGQQYKEAVWALNMAKAAFDRITGSKRKWTGRDQDAYEAVEQALKMLGENKSDDNGKLSLPTGAEVKSIC